MVEVVEEVVRVGWNLTWATRLGMQRDGEERWRKTRKYFTSEEG